jgi:hypothetical protein
MPVSERLMYEYFELVVTVIRGMSRNKQMIWIQKHS